MFTKQKKQIELILIGLDVVVFILSAVFTIEILDLIIFPVFLHRPFQIFSATLNTLFPFLILIWLYMNWRANLYDLSYYEHRSLVTVIFQYLIAYHFSNLASISELKSLQFLLFPICLKISRHFVF